MHIAPARLEDARQVAEIHVTTWQSAYQGIVPAEYLASLSVDQREAMWRGSIADGVPELLVAKVEGGMIGWVAFGPCRDEGSPADCAELWAYSAAGFAPDLSSVKEFELGGEQVEEIRYARALE